MLFLALNTFGCVIHFFQSDFLFDMTNRKLWTEEIQSWEVWGQRNESSEREKVEDEERGRGKGRISFSEREKEKANER